MRSQAVRKILYPRHVFRIARGAKPQVENVFLALEQDGVIGYGEASPNAFYGEEADHVHMSLLGLSDWLKRQKLGGPEDIARLWEASWEYLSPSRAAQCALDLALWDLSAKSAGLSVNELVWGRPASSLLSSVTLGLAEAEEQARILAGMKSFKRIKLKLDRHPDWAGIRGFQAENPAAWALDANAAWTLDQALAWAEDLASLSPALLEQPFPPALDQDISRLGKACAFPIFADESCRNLEDIRRLADGYAGVNIKLVKAGGLTPALAMSREAKKLGYRRMVGCMLESSLLIAAGLVLAQDAEWADLDGAWLLQQDPMVGLAWKEGLLCPSPQPGFGVNPWDRIPE